MSDNYTFIAYKPDSMYYCCGNSGQYSSAFIFAPEEPRQEIVVLLCRCLLANKLLRDQEDGFDVIHILNDGHPVSPEERAAIFAEAEQNATVVHQELKRQEQEKKEKQRRQDQAESEEAGRILAEALFKEKNDVG